MCHESARGGNACQIDVARAAKEAAAAAAPQALSAAPSATLASYAPAVSPAPNEVRSPQTEQVPAMATLRFAQPPEQNSNRELREPIAQYEKHTGRLQAENSSLRAVTVSMDINVDVNTPTCNVVSMRRRG